MPDRHRAEVMLASGARVKAVARKFKVPYESLRNHWKKHVAPHLKREMIAGKTAAFRIADRVEDESASVLDNLKYIRSGLFRLFEVSLDADDQALGSIVAGRLHENLSLCAKLTGELASSPLVQINNQTNFYALPEYHQMQMMLLRVLRDYPDARAAVIKGFRQFEQQNFESKPVKQIEARPNGKAIHPASPAAE